MLAAYLYSRLKFQKTLKSVQWAITVLSLSTVILHNDCPMLCLHRAFGELRYLHHVMPGISLTYKNKVATCLYVYAVAEPSVFPTPTSSSTDLCGVFLGFPRLTVSLMNHSFYILISSQGIHIRWRSERSLLWVTAPLRLFYYVFN